MNRFGTKVSLVGVSLLALGLPVAPAAHADVAPPLATASASVALPGSPSLAVSSGSTVVIASSSLNGRGPGTLAIVDATTPAVTRSVQIGPNPMGLAITPDGARVVTSSWDEKAVRIINARSGALVKKVSVGGKADAVTIGPKGTSAFVYVIDKGYIAKVDLASAKVKGRYPLKTCKNNQPVGLAVTPDSSTLLVSCDEAGLIFMNTSSGRVLGTVDAAGGGTPVFSPDGSLAYAGASAYFTVVDVAQRKAVGDSMLIVKGDGGIDGVDSPMSIAVSPDGSAVYAVMPEVGQVSVLDPRSGKQLSRISADGKTLVGARSAVAGPNGRLSVMARQLLSIDMSSNQVVGADPIDPPVSAGSTLRTVMLDPVLANGSRIGIAWMTFDGDTQKGAGLTVLTMS